VRLALAPKTIGVAAEEDEVEEVGGVSDKEHLDIEESK
jgi:hypothetical protein